MSGNVERMDPSTRFVRSLDGEYFMVREAAEMLGVSHTTLRALLKEDSSLGPSFCAFFGKVKIYLYTREDIGRVRAHLAKVKQVVRTTPSTAASNIGRPPKWQTDEQRHRRQLLFSNRHYWSRKAKRLSEQGEEEAAQAAQARVEEINTKLEQMEKELA